MADTTLTGGISFTIEEDLSMGYSGSRSPVGQHLQVHPEYVDGRVP